MPPGHLTGLATGPGSRPVALQSMQGCGKLASGPGPQEDKLDEGVLRVPQAPGALGGGTHTHLRKGPQASHRAPRLTRAPW